MLSWLLLRRASACSSASEVLRLVQESLLAEQRSTFEVKQAAAQVKLEAEEKVKAKERVVRRKLIKEKDADRQRVFVQMKQRLEDRRQTFLDEQERREHMLQLVQVKLARERELKREELRLKAIAKTEMVRKARRIEEYERTQAMDRVASCIYTITAAGALGAAYFTRASPITAVSMSGPKSTGW